jgi:hypothetical protein
VKREFEAAAGELKAANAVIPETTVIFVDGYFAQMILLSLPFPQSHLHSMHQMPANAPNQPPHLLLRSLFMPEIL